VVSDVKVVRLGVSDALGASPAVPGLYMFGRKVRVGLLLVWYAVIWTVWASRKDLIFVGGLLREEQMVDRVKLLAWKWFLAKCPASSCSLYEWEVQPVLCLNR